MTFFDAIRTRQYYSTIEETNPLQVQRCQGKLFRSLARYVVVALLLQLPSAFIYSLLDEMAALNDAARDVALEARLFLTTLTGSYSCFEQLTLRLSRPIDLQDPSSRLVQAVLISAVSGQVSLVAAPTFGCPSDPTRVGEVQRVVSGSLSHGFGLGACKQ
jgi:hypothetical protein